MSPPLPSPVTLQFYFVTDISNGVMHNPIH